MNEYLNFQHRFKLLTTKHPDLIINTLSNIFTMRLIGNKTHGDLAEIGIAEFVHQFMYDFDSRHVGKDLFRAKKHEEDIVIINELNNTEIPISLKAYGEGPLQLSTDRDSLLFPFIKSYGKIIEGATLENILESNEFRNINSINIMPLIYREKEKQCNIMVFDFEKARENAKKIIYVDVNEQYNEETQKIEKAKGRIHPVFLILDEFGKYIYEIRYGNAAANALQRGVWTHTKKAENYFMSLTNGWISYKHNHTLVKLLRLALNSRENSHEEVNSILQEDIKKMYEGSHAK